MRYSPQIEDDILESERRLAEEDYEEELATLDAAVEKAEFLKDAEKEERILEKLRPEDLDN